MRTKGYVVGYDQKAGELVWTVKVKDVQSLHNGRKYSVASLHPGTMLTKPGVEVTFDIRPVGEIGDITAVDVSLGSKFPEDCSVEKDSPDEAMSFAIVEENGIVYAWYNECKTHDECKEWLEEQSEECHLVEFLQINVNRFGKKDSQKFNEDSAAIFKGLLTMMKDVEAVNHAISVVVMEAFVLGQKTNK